MPSLIMRQGTPPHRYVYRKSDVYTIDRDSFTSVTDKEEPSASNK